MITFNKNDLKAYLKKKTGNEVSSIYSIQTEIIDWDNKIPDDMYLKLHNNEGSSIKVEAYCQGGPGTSQYKDKTYKTFLWEETVKVSDFTKFLRLKKLHKINKSII